MRILCAMSNFVAMVMRAAEVWATWLGECTKYWTVL